MLRLGDGRGIRAQRLVAELRGRDADAVDVPGRQAGSAREPDIERVDIRAFAA